MLQDSPYIRVIGFLYLRYTCDPEKLWSWYEPYLDDPEEFNASSNPNVKTYVSSALAPCQSPLTISLPWALIAPLASGSWAC